ncbi:MAG: hypothetical protein HYR91_08135 [Flavobacteriia bacterium]|nr:hypothetical protein [Flavobacteriia bacterium]
MTKYFVCALLFGFYACSDFHKSEQLADIEKMSKALDSAAIVLSEHPIEKMNEIKAIYLEIEDEIRMNHSVKDTISLEFGKKMDALKMVRLTFEPLEKAYENLSIGLKNEKKRNLDLKTDIENSNGERENYQQNVDFENKKVEKLLKLLANYTRIREKSLTIFNQYKDEMKAFADSIAKQ